MDTLLGFKKEQSQRFLEDGTRIPVTQVRVLGNSVVFIKSKDRDGYWALQLGIGTKKHSTKALLGHIKGAATNGAPSFLREVRLSENDVEGMPKIGDIFTASQVFKAGDIVNITGISKGKGFAGVVKRHHFRGGPRTHGQSDRERAPGSIGQTTTPGRVYKGKRMAGRMGAGKTTVRNLEIVDVNDDWILIKGLVPGAINSFLMIKKIAENKKFIPLYTVFNSSTGGKATSASQEETKSEKDKKEKEDKENAV